MVCVCVCAYKRIRRAIYTPSSELDTSKLDNIDSHLTSSSLLLAYFPDIHNTTFLLTPNIVKQVNKSWPRIFSCRPCYAHFILSWYNKNKISFPCLYIETNQPETLVYRGPFSMNRKNKKRKKTKQLFHILCSVCALSLSFCWDKSLEWNPIEGATPS
jgi:hypothetical protein